MPDTPSPGSTAAYGATRNRSANVSYLEVERAALAILATDKRPSIALIREQLGRGAPATIASALKRFWRDLGVRAQGDPAALTRIPSEIAETVEALWQRALQLASAAAKNDDNGARERLAQIQTENELRAQSFNLREKELETAARERDRSIQELREHLRSTIKMLESDRAVLTARDARIADLEEQLDGARVELARIVNKAGRSPKRRKRPVNSPSEIAAAGGRIVST